MKVFKFHPPYKANGRTNFPEASNRTGVYLIKENNKLVYVGYSASDLYKTLYRHFQEWTDKNYNHPRIGAPATRITYVKKMKRNKYTVRVIFCTVAQAARLEKMLIIKHQPRDNTLKYENYTIDFYDEKVIDIYTISPVETEVPF